MPGSSAAAAQTQSRQPEDCTICLVSMDVAQGNLSSIRPCAHTFHTECIERWRRSPNASNRQCPNCRSPITFTERLGEIGALARPIAQPIIELVPVAGTFFSNRAPRRAAESDGEANARTRANPWPRARANARARANPWVNPNVDVNGAQVSSNLAKGLRFALNAAFRPVSSAAIGAFGSWCLKKSRFSSDPKLVAIESLVGSAITSIPVAALQTLGEDRKGLGVLDIGVEALNAYIGNRILNHSSVLPGAAAAAGAMGSVTLPFAIVGGVLGGAVAGVVIYLGGKACVDALRAL